MRLPIFQKVLSALGHGAFDRDAAKCESLRDDLRPRWAQLVRLVAERENTTAERAKTLLLNGYLERHLDQLLKGTEL